MIPIKFYHFTIMLCNNFSQLNLELVCATSLYFSSIFEILNEKARTKFHIRNFVVFVLKNLHTHTKVGIKSKLLILKSLYT